MGEGDGAVKPRAAIVAHADWSVDPRKRWMAVARRDGREGWRLAAPSPVGPPGALIGTLLEIAGGGPVLLGLDLPLGVPRGYGALRDETDFPAFLRAADPALFAVCATLADVSAMRPFYPARPAAGMTRAAHAAALGLSDARALCRLCDRATPERPAGAPVFWTLGANQSGKAALSAWRDLVRPALAETSRRVALWPFEGSVRALLAPGRVVLAETYPAEALRHLGLRLRGSKRRAADRVALGPALRAAMERLRVRPDLEAEAAIEAGFGADPAGEDRLDCTLGVLCAIGVLDGARPDFVPDDPAVRRWEGWVLGQTALPLDPPPAGQISR